MAHATMSLLGLYHYNPRILDGFQLPRDLEPDRDTIMGNLLLETAELEILYPDPDFLADAIRFWSSKQLRVWQELWDTTQYEYNPIWNKDGTVIETETRDLKGSDKHTRMEERDTAGNVSRNDLETRDLAGTSSGETHAEGTDKHYVFGYNETTAAQDTEATSESGTSDSVDTTSTGTVRHEETTGSGENEKISGSESIDRADTGTIKHERIEQGNIGVTTTQAMIREQREVVLFNIQDHIITDFKRRFCILVY